MKKEELIPGRRTVMRIATCLGAAVTARILTTGQAQTPGLPAAPPVAAGPKAGPVAKVPLAPSTYRLQPMTADAPPGYRRPAPPVRQEAFLKLPHLGHSMVLSFDDGPDARYTPQILRTLREHDVRAMFFVCGEMAGYYPDLLREMEADGHLVGNHSWSHPLLPTLTPGGIRNELERTSEVVEKAIGAPPVWFRAPYGAWNRPCFDIGAELGMEPLAWSIDTLDWSSPGTDRIVHAVLEGAEPGAVVLQHDAGGNRSQSVAALRRYLPELIDAGYDIMIPHP